MSRQFRGRDIESTLSTSGESPSLKGHTDLESHDGNVVGACLIKREETTSINITTAPSVKRRETARKSFRFKNNHNNVKPMPEGSIQHFTQNYQKKSREISRPVVNKSASNARDVSFKMNTVKPEYSTNREVRLLLQDEGVQRILNEMEGQPRRTRTFTRFSGDDTKK